jgi:hypothetical protein
MTDKIKENNSEREKALDTAMQNIEQRPCRISNKDSVKAL